MVTISVFGKQGCAKCRTTKHKLTHFIAQWDLGNDVTLVFHDLETVDGRAEGAFYDVLNIPVTLVEKEGQSVARWDGEVPNSESVRVALEENASVAAR